MNDRYKFRVWCENNQEWEKDTILISNKNMYEIRNDKFTKYTDIDPKNHIINFCTGIKDKNGKLIYEGDIVRTWKFSTGITKLSVIVWNEARCGFRLCDIDNYRRNIHRYPQSMVNVTTIEVLGNIYENPELLEEKNVNL